MSLSKGVFVVASKRTAFGTFGGRLKDLSAVQLGAVAAKGALAQLPAGTPVDSVIFGNVAQSTTDCAYLARHAALKAGLPVETPAVTVNRLCGSGFESIVQGAQQIICGDAEVVLTGGAESMSMAPYLVHGIRWGSPLGTNPPMVDSLWDTLKDQHINCPMAITAENLAEKYGVTLEQSNELALRSQQLWHKANEAGLLKAEITPVMVKDKKLGEVAFEVDEHPRPKTTKEDLAKLKPLFKKGGVVTAGNASGISDGAGAVVVASKKAVDQHKIKPMARIVSYAVAGVDPTIMGFGPVPAINLALKRAGLKLDQMDLIEINEAFAAQFLACQKVLGFDMSKANLQGGATALGHPTGASGSRIMGHLAYELQRTGKRYAVGSACIGGGQGIAIILERC
jgi:acetyl-CoA acyltransferase 2